jgi:hypothetical protein
VTQLKYLNNIKSLVKKTIRIIDVILLYVSYLTFPSYAYFFSTRKLFPAQKDRWTKNKFKPFLILNKPKKKFKKINIVTKGSSFDLNEIKKFKDPTFLVGFTTTLRIKNNNIFYKHVYPNVDGIHKRKGINKNLKLFQKKNLYYTNFNPPLATWMHKDDKILSISVLRKEPDTKKYFWPGYQKIKKKLKILNKFKSIKKVKIVENVYKNYDIKEKLWAPFGSTIPAIYYLLSVSEKINVYGWDFYFDKKVNNYNFFSFLKNIYKFQLDTKRSWNHIESCLMNLYFAYILEKRKDISLKGNLSGLKSQKKFIRKFEKVIFKC